MSLIIIMPFVRSKCFRNRELVVKEEYFVIILGYFSYFIKPYVEVPIRSASMRRF